MCAFLMSSIAGVVVLLLCVLIPLIGVVTLYWTVKYGNADFFDNVRAGDGQERMGKSDL